MKPTLQFLIWRAEVDLGALLDFCRERFDFHERTKDVSVGNYA